MRAQFWAKVVLVALLFGLFVLAVETVRQSPDLPGLLRSLQNETGEGASVGHLRLDSHAIESRQPGHLIKARFAVSNRGREDLKRIEIACAVHDRQGNSLGLYRWTGFAVVPAGGKQVYTFAERRYVSRRALLDQAECRIVGARKAGRPFSLTGHEGEPTDGGGAKESGHGSADAH